MYDRGSGTKQIDKITFFSVFTAGPKPSDVPRERTALAL